jgi:hypothetical protein
MLLSDSSSVLFPPAHAILAFMRAWRVGYLVLASEHMGLILFSRVLIAREKKSVQVFQPGLHCR